MFIETIVSRETIDVTRYIYFVRIKERDLREAIKQALGVNEYSYAFGYVPPNVPNYEGQSGEDDVVNVNAITDHDLEKEIKALPDRDVDDQENEQRHKMEGALRSLIRKLLK